MLTKVFRQPLTVGHAVVLLGATALLVVGATSIAAIPGPDGTIKGCIKKRAPNKGALRVIDHNKRCARTETTLTWNQKGTPGIAGARGEQGSSGTPGADGQPGAAGSPDSGQDILGKLAPVDGAGSGLDADALDGRPSADFLPARVANFGGEANATPLSWTYYFFDTNGAAGTEFDIGSGFIHIERTGTPGQFKVCARNNVATGYNVPFVVRVADDPTADIGSLTEPTGTTESCSSAFTVADGREFSVHVQGAHIVGTPFGNVAGTGALANRWRLIGFAF
jgi:hypothetical protein